MIAGLLDRWTDQDSTPRAACAIVTTAAATDDLRALHDRMPVVLPLLLHPDAARLRR